MTWVKQIATGGDDNYSYLLGNEAAVALVDPLLHDNARQLFRLDEKTRILRKAPWINT